MSGFTSIVVPTPEAVQNPEQVQATLARADSAHSPSNPQPAAPATTQERLLAGKYKTAADLEAGYKEAQAFANRLNTELQALKKQAAPAPAPAADPAPKAPEPTKTPEPAQTLEIQEKPKETAEAVLESKGLSFDKYAESFAQNGKLTDEDMAELDKAGISRTLVETYVKGVEALREKTVREAHALVGGEQVFSQMVQWASASLSSEEIQAYNEAVAKGGESQKLALLGLRSRFESRSQTVEANLLDGKTSVTTSAYQSIREMSMAQRDPRYGKDPAYTREVEARARASKF